MGQADRDERRGESQSRCDLAGARLVARLRWRRNDNGGKRTLVIFIPAIMQPGDNARRKPGYVGRLLLKYLLAGPCALWHGQSGQGGNEAATAISRKCRRQGSPPHSNIPCILMKSGGIASAASALSCPTKLPH